MYQRMIILLWLISKAYAATPIDGLYSVAFGGLSLVPGNMNTATLNNSSYASGFNAGGSIGYKQAFWRYEAEVSYIKADLNRININQVQFAQPTLMGYSQAVVGLLNTYFDLPYQPSSLLQPFIGAGLGYAWVQDTINAQPAINALYNNNAFAYQGTAGLTFHFSENYGLNVAYRYVGTNRIGNLGAIFQAHLISGGVIYRFDECEFK